VKTAATHTAFLRQGSYVEDDDAQTLVSKSSWTLKATGILFGALLLAGRTASSGAIVWTPTYHPASTPLNVIATPASKSGAPSRQPPKSSPGSDSAALAKRAAAYEVVAFSAG